MNEKTTNRCDGFEPEFTPPFPVGKEYSPLPLNQLRARASFADEWYEEGRISKLERSRLKADAWLRHDTGPIRWIY